MELFTQAAQELSPGARVTDVHRTRECGLVELARRFGHGCGRIAKAKRGTPVEDVALETLDLFTLVSTLG